MFAKFFKSLFPTVKADDDELVDPQQELREKCGAKPNIEALFTKYQACNDRVNGKARTTETCTEELIDYLHELDHCVAHSLWPKLK